jgi:hypothetical protein
MYEGITLRYAFPDDDAAVAHLAALDSAEVPPAPLLLAEVAGDVRAALSLVDGRVIADPFHRSLALVALLRERGQQLTAIRAERRWRPLRWMFLARVRTRRRVQPGR